MSHSGEDTSKQKLALMGKNPLAFDAERGLTSKDGMMQRGPQLRGPDSFHDTPRRIYIIELRNRRTGSFGYI